LTYSSLKQKGQVGRENGQSSHLIKHSLDNDCQISTVQVRHKTWIHNEIQNKTKKKMCS